MNALLPAVSVAVQGGRDARAGMDQESAELACTTAVYAFDRPDFGSGPRGMVTTGATATLELPEAAFVHARRDVRGARSLCRRGGTYS